MTKSKTKMRPVLTAVGHVLHAQLAMMEFKIKMRQVLIAAEQPVMHAVGIWQPIISYSS